MKKFLATLLIAGSLAMTACGETILSASNSESKLKSNSYAVEVYSDTEAKARVQGINWEGFKVTNVVLCEKGTGDNKDVFLGFFFGSINEASKFVEENIAVMNSYVEKELGSSLKARVGSHNNVAYAGSETSFSCAF